MSPIPFPHCAQTKAARAHEPRGRARLGRPARSRLTRTSSFQFGLELFDPAGRDPWRIWGHVENLDSVNGTRGGRRSQSLAHQFGHSLTKRQRAALSVAPHYLKYVVIEAQSRTHAIMMSRCRSDVNRCVTASCCDYDARPYSRPHSEHVFEILSETP